MWGLILTSGILAIGAGLLLADWWISLPDDAVATYVGRSSCSECHAKEVDAWTGSHHDLAMDLANEETVLGDFHDATTTQFGITSRMYRQDGRYMVCTEGPDGQMHDFEVKYVFGVTPLQQYMVEFDRSPDMADGEVPRLQVLRICWDTVRGRWFYLGPPDVKEKLAPDDELHWTGISQRWNNMCADCHSTNLQKNFDPQSNGYRTTFSEIDVSCETCHGPASLHVQLARRRVWFWDRKRGYGLPRLKSENAEVQIHSCAPCHSRRSALHPDPRPGENYYNFYAHELLQSNTYHADGQILDEVYELASFLQSKMYHKGIRCTDCHDPHSIRLKYSGNQVCTSCHQHPAGKYDVVAHHRHTPGSLGSQCVECHMPETTYMANDPRRDHSLRVSHPGVSVDLGTPNACTRCHLERAQLPPEKAASLAEYADWLEAARRGDTEVREALARADRWSLEKCTEWYGAKEDLKSHYAYPLSAARSRNPAALPGLLDLVKDRRLSAIVRATGLLELTAFDSPQVAQDCAELLQDPSPLVRAGAIPHLQQLPDESLVRLAAPLLADPVRLVRIEAARALAHAPDQLLNGSERRWLEAAIVDCKLAAMVNNDRAGGHLSLAVLYQDLRDYERAREAYELAIRVEPRMSGARSNLAALLEQIADEAGSRTPSQTAQPKDGRLRMSVDPQEYRRRAAQLRKEELILLARDAALVPNNAPVQHRYGLALYLQGRLKEAEEKLREAYRLEPNTPDFALALALLYQKQQRYTEALDFAQRLIDLRPGDPSYQQLVAEIRQQIGKN